MAGRMKRWIPFVMLTVLAAADAPGALVRARDAQGGAENLAAVKNVRLTGVLTAGNVTYRYAETWTASEILCTWKTSDDEVSRGFDGSTGWMERGIAVALSEEETGRLKEGLRLRRLLLLQADEEFVEDGEDLRAGKYRLHIGPDGTLITLQFGEDDEETSMRLDRWVKAGAITFPSRWRISLKAAPAAGATYVFSRVETGVEIPDGFFRRELAKSPDAGGEK